MYNGLWHKPTNNNNIYKEEGSWYFQRNCRVGGNPLQPCGRVRVLSYQDAWKEWDLDMAYWKEMEDA